MRGAREVGRLRLLPVGASLPVPAATTPEGAPAAPSATAGSEALAIVTGSDDGVVRPPERVSMGFMPFREQIGVQEKPLNAVLLPGDACTPADQCIT